MIHEARTIGTLIEQAEALVRDHRLGSVRAWKQRTNGLAIGFLPTYVPREMFHAQGVLPVGLTGMGDDLEIIRGDAFYQSYICHLPRSTIELGLNGSLDCLDGVVFPATCDVIRNLSGVWRMQFPGQLVRYLDVPQDFEREVGGAFYRRELEDLARDLERRGARPLAPDALRASIRVYNQNRHRVRELRALRQSEPWRVPTAELYLVLRAGLLLPVEEHNALLAEYQELVLAANERQPLDQARVVLTGSFCEQPPLGLIKTLERAGCYIVDDDFMPVLQTLVHDVKEGGDPLQNLVDAFLFDGRASPVRWCGNPTQGQDLVQRVEESAAEGVLYCAPSFCDPALLDQPMSQKALDARGIPWTSFKYSENSGQFQVIREQAGTFADSIKLWSGA
jgi:benzoyl-CoA reductase subunit C